MQITSGNNSKRRMSPTRARGRMKLQNLRENLLLQERHIQDLHFLLGQSGRAERRPCDSCNLSCPCSGSLTCACACAPDCNHAPVAMSADGERYPIEGKIAPLVFCFNCFGVCQPYWSCEGHQLSAEQAVKVPQVWFYARSLIYPKLIAEYLARLNATSAIDNRWQICVTFVECNLDVGFSIKPDLAFNENPCLASMQEDAQIIAGSLLAGVRTLATEYIRRYDSSNHGVANAAH